jgi:hypothetical protein
MFLMFFSMFSNANVDILVDNGNTATRRIFFNNKVFVVSQANPIETYVRGHEKTTFHYAHVSYVMCWTCCTSVHIVTQ